MPTSMQIIPICQSTFQPSHDLRFESVSPILLIQDASVPTWHHPPRTQSVSRKVARCLWKFQRVKVRLTPIKHPGHDDRLGAYNDDLGDSEYSPSRCKVLFAVLTFVVLLVPGYTILEPLSPP